MCIRDSKEGNSQELNKYLGDKVDLIIQNKSTHADKRTAEGTMAAFVSNHKVGSFNVNHQGKRDESGFVIGTLMTANGKRCIRDRTGSDTRVSCSSEGT